MNDIIDLTSSEAFLHILLVQQLLLPLSLSMLTFAKWLSRHQRLRKLVKRDFSVAIHIDPSDDGHLVLLTGNESMFPHVILKVLVINEIVAPVINLTKHSLNVKSLVGLQIHSDHVKLPVEDDFFVEESCEFSFDMWIKVSLRLLTALLVDDH